MKKKEIIIALVIVVLGVTQYNTNLKLEAIKELSDKIVELEKKI